MIGAPRPEKAIPMSEVKPPKKEDIRINVICSLPEKLMERVLSIDVDQEGNMTVWFQEKEMTFYADGRPVETTLTT